MNLVMIQAYDVDSGLELNPQITFDGAPQGTVPQQIDTRPGRHTVGFGNVPTYVCLTPSITVDVPADGATAASGQYRRT